MTTESRMRRRFPLLPLPHWRKRLSLQIHSPQPSPENRTGFRQKEHQHQDRTRQLNYRRLAMSRTAKQRTSPRLILEWHRHRTIRRVFPVRQHLRRELLWTLHQICFMERRTKSITGTPMDRSTSGNHFRPRTTSPRMMLDSETRMGHHRRKPFQLRWQHRSLLPLQPYRPSSHVCPRISLSALQMEMAQKTCHCLLRALRSDSP